MAKGKFIVFSGGEGSGKSTQVKLLAEFLESQGKNVLLTKEPGGDPIGNDIRSILLNPKYKDIFSYRAELLLFIGNRAQHVEKIIKPAVKIGKIGLCDRFSPDTFAYQCGGRRICTPEEFRMLDNFATGGLQPDFYIYIDIEPVVGLARKSKEGVETRFEKEALEFHQRVRAGFKKFFYEFIAKDKWQEFDGNLPIQELHRQIVDCLKQKQLI